MRCRMVTVRMIGRFLPDSLEVPWQIVERLAGQVDVDDPSCLISTYTMAVNTARSSAGAVPPPCGRAENSGSNGCTNSHNSSGTNLCDNRSSIECDHARPSIIHMRRRLRAPKAAGVGGGISRRRSESRFRRPIVGFSSGPKRGSGAGCIRPCWTSSELRARSSGLVPYSTLPLFAPKKGINDRAQPGRSREGRLQDSPCD